MTRPDDVLTNHSLASDALATLLRDERCGIAIKFGMTGACQNAALEAISKALATARSEQREEDARIAEGFETEETLFPFKTDGVENQAAAAGQEYAADEIAAAIRNGGE